MRNILSSVSQRELGEALLSPLVRLFWLIYGVKMISPPQASHESMSCAPASKQSPSARPSAECLLHQGEFTGIAAGLGTCFSRGLDWMISRCSFQPLQFGSVILVGQACVLELVLWFQQPSAHSSWLHPTHPSPPCHHHLSTLCSPWFGLTRQTLILNCSNIAFIDFYVFFYVFYMKYLFHLWHFWNYTSGILTNSCKLKENMLNLEQMGWINLLIWEEYQEK